MQPVNLKSMFASAAIMFDKLDNAEEVDSNAMSMQLDQLNFMLKILETAHKITIGRCQFENYETVWNKLNPQLKNYDALPE
jgi:hypothetical protein